MALGGQQPLVRVRPGGGERIIMAGGRIFRESFIENHFQVPP
jgi:hypothetical protein